MTEAEWLTCEDPEPMLESLRDRGTNRKLRLFNAACRRQSGEINVGTLDAMYLDILEGVADGTLSQVEIDRLKANCWANFNEWPVAVTEPILVGLFQAHLKSELEHADAQDAYFPACWTLQRLSNDMDNRALSSICGCLRDIFGNPFRPFAFLPEWRTSTAIAISQQMYDSRDFSAMPILADALQDAGCVNDDVLTHCRDANQVHVRGCWVVDLMLGKE